MLYKLRSTLVYNAHIVFSQKKGVHSAESHLQKIIFRKDKIISALAGEDGRYFNEYNINLITLNSDR